jgi:hypothetical protein
MADFQDPHPRRTHLYLWDRTACTEFAARMGVSEEKLRKAIRIVGSRVTTLSSYLKA